MEAIKTLVDLFLHLDAHLHAVIQQYGAWTYVILFVIVFCETGLVVTPILPGDSLLFAAGAIAAGGSLNVGWIIALLLIAGVSGDAVNYHIGRFLGPKVFHKTDSRIFKKEYLDRTHAFYERYGGKTIIIARFVPIVRTFAPFVAGVGKMTYWRFACYNVVGAALWVVLAVMAGYFFGSHPVVKKNFSLVIIAIVAISLLPGVIEVVRQRRLARKAEAG